MILNSKVPAVNIEIKPSGLWVSNTKVPSSGFLNSWFGAIAILSHWSQSFAVQRINVINFLSRLVIHCRDNWNKAIKHLSWHSKVPALDFQIKRSILRIIHTQVLILNSHWNKFFCVVNLYKIKKICSLILINMYYQISNMYNRW